MEIISFDISGKFAHFRKYYANNTAITYSLPPRTTITGILAAIGGKEKDTYYEDFSSDNLMIAVNIISNVKKNFHRLNLLQIKGPGDFRGRLKTHIQTPFEVVSGFDARKDFVKYRIFIANKAENDKLFNELKDRLLQRDFIYAPTLGTANFSAYIDNVVVFEKARKIEAKNDVFEIDSAVLSDTVDEILFDQDAKNIMIEEELLPADFVSNHNRELKKMNRVLFTFGDLPIKVKITGNLYQLEHSGNIQTIQFLD